MKISCRDKVVLAFPQGGLTHDIQMPTNLISPDVDGDDPSKYSGISDQYYFCAKCCKPVLIKIQGEKKDSKKSCPICHSPRVSMISRDKSYSQNAMQPGLLNFDSGASSNPLGTTDYHGPTAANTDTFSTNLLKP
jgi:hypothetical protein